MKHTVQPVMLSILRATVLAVLCSGHAFADWYTVGNECHQSLTNAIQWSTPCSISATGEYSHAVGAEAFAWTVNADLNADATAGFSSIQANATMSLSSPNEGYCQAHSVAIDTSAFVDQGYGGDFCYWGYATAYFS